MEEDASARAKAREASMKIRKYPQAEQDIADAVTHYARESGNLSGRFLQEVEAVIVRIKVMPHSGSLRFARELDIQDLRAYSLHNFPYLIFYIGSGKYIDIVRVLHSSRDIYHLPFGSD